MQFLTEYWVFNILCTNTIVPDVWNVLYLRENALFNVFSARRYVSMVYAIIVCLSVRPSACLSQIDVLLKLPNVESHKQR